MRDDLDDLRVTLREAANDFRPSFDAATLAKAGRRAQVRNRILGGAAGIAVLTAAVGFGLPALRGSALLVPAVPVAPSPEAPVGSTVPGGFSVDMTNWRTFSSREYPVTFRYPPDWTVDDDLGGDGKDLGPMDGCDTLGCELFVNPPDPAEGTPVALTRSGFGPGNSLRRDSAGLELVTVVPDLLVWRNPADTIQAQAAILRQPRPRGGVADYLLGSSTEPLQTSLAVGDTNPLADHPEARFRFATSVDDGGGSRKGDSWTTVVMILGTARPNPDFAPTRVP